MKNVMKPQFVVCSQLKVYNDMGWDYKKETFTHTGISLCECQAYINKKKCKERGRCIIARENATWKQVSSKSFGEKKSQEKM